MCQFQMLNSEYSTLYCSDSLLGFGSLDHFERCPHPGCSPSRSRSHQSESGHLLGLPGGYLLHYRQAAYVLPGQRPDRVPYLLPGPGLADLSHVRLAIGHCEVSRARLDLGPCCRQLHLDSLTLPIAPHSTPGFGPWSRWAASASWCRRGL